MTTVALICTRCSDEGHLIRVAPGRLAPLHLTRHDHPFRLGRLARTGDDQPTIPVVGVRRPSEESDMPRGQAANALPSSRTPNRTRPAGNGRTRTVSPPGSFR